MHQIEERKVNVGRVKLILLVGVVFLTLLTPLRTAMACYCLACYCSTTSRTHDDTQRYINNLLDDYFELIGDEFIGEYLVEQFWWPALRKFTEQVTLSSQKSMLEIGSTLSDTKQAEAKQKKIQEAQIDAVTETTPDEDGACQYASLAQSFVATDVKAKATKSVLKTQGTSRSLGGGSGPAARGPDRDRISRFQQAATHYIKPTEMGGELDQGGYSNATSSDRYDRDISSWWLEQGFLDIDFEDGVSTPDEEDIFALKSNLYNNTVLTRLVPSDIEKYATLDEFDDLRSLATMQGIAEASFDDIVSLKVASDPSTGSTVRATLRSLGYTDQGIDRLIGANDTPSYLQQLELLGKKIHNVPDSYIKKTVGTTALLRQQTIKEAVELMVKFEIYKSLQRSTLMATSLHELERRGLQATWESQVVSMGGQ